MEIFRSSIAGVHPVKVCVRRVYGRQRAQKAAWGRLLARRDDFNATDEKSKGKAKISAQAEKWLLGELSLGALDTMSNRELQILWWCVVLILNARYGRNLDLLERLMTDRGIDIPQKGAKILQKVR